MSVAVWPQDLSRFLRAVYSGVRQDGRRRRASEGLPEYRRRFSRTAQQVTLGIEVDDAGRALFNDFFGVVTAGGSLPFTLPDPTRDAAPLLTDAGAPLLSSDGREIGQQATWLCLFGDELPSEQIVASRFQIIFSVWVMP